MPEVDIAELTKPFPLDAIDRREGGGGKFFDYIKTHAVINRLNKACHYQWDWRIVEQHMEGNTLLVCRGELTIPGLGTRAAVGVQDIKPNGGSDLWKGASSDAMKKAAQMFGVGIELAGPDVEAEGYQRPQPATRQAQRPQGAYQGDRAEPIYRAKDGGGRY